MPRKKKEEVKIEEPKTEQEVKPVYEKVDPIDRLPALKFDGDEEIQLIEEIEKEKVRIDIARDEWMDRKLEYLTQWDNYTSYPSNALLDGVKNVHIPMTFEKLQAWHSRMYKSIFAVDPVFTMIPVNSVSIDEMEATRKVLWWYLTHEINFNAGLKPVIDEMLWDLGTDGWAVIHKSWRKVQRKMLDLEEIPYDAIREKAAQVLGLAKKGKIQRKEFKEIEKLVTRFQGVVLETVPHECVYFPDYIPTSGDMNYPPIVMLEKEYSEQDLIVNRENGFFDEDATGTVIEKGKGATDSRKLELKRLRQEHQGVRDWDRGEGFPAYTVYLRKDLRGDKYPQEYVLTVSFKAKKILRATYLDRTCRDGNRPIYKFDLIKRPRSAYSRGFPELLYPYNLEIDEYHNIRRISGFMTNIPWGFYRPGGGLEKEKIEIAPGKFYPTDDPNSDVREMNFSNKTAWAMQEEGLTQAYADKLVSMPPMMQGQVPQMVGPLRSTSGVTALMNEAMVPMDVYLDRIRVPFGQMLAGVLSDIQHRLPPMIKAIVLGEDGEYAFQQIPRTRIMGQYRFLLAANDAQYNPEKERQNAMVLSQMLLSQTPVQMGLVGIEEAYEVLKHVLEKSNYKQVGKYLKAPPKIGKPLNLFHEYMMCLNGRMPIIVLNDDHEAKWKGLQALAQHPEYQIAKDSGTASPASDVMLQAAVMEHMRQGKILESLKAQQNVSGMETPVTLGSRSTGNVTERGEPAQGGVNERGRTGEAERAVPESGMEGGGGVGEEVA